MEYCRENGAYAGCECAEMQTSSHSDADGPDAVLAAALRLSSKTLGAAQLEDLYPTDLHSFYHSSDAQWRVIL